MIPHKTIFIIWIFIIDIGCRVLGVPWWHRVDRSKNIHIHIHKSTHMDIWLYRCVCIDNVSRKNVFPDRFGRVTHSVRFVLANSAQLLCLPTTLHCNASPLYFRSLVLRFSSIDCVRLTNSELSSTSTSSQSSKSHQRSRPLFPSLLLLSWPLIFLFP